MGSAGSVCVCLCIELGVLMSAGKNLLQKNAGYPVPKAYTEMMDNVENVEVNLGKSIVSASETNNMLIMNDVWRQAFEAQARLNELPVYHPVLERTSVF